MMVVVMEGGGVVLRIERVVEPLVGCHHGLFKSIRRCVTNSLSTNFATAEYQGRSTSG